MKQRHISQLPQKHHSFKLYLVNFIQIFKFQLLVFGVDVIGEGVLNCSL